MIRRATARRLGIHWEMVARAWVIGRVRMLVRGGAVGQTQRSCTRGKRVPTLIDACTTRMIISLSRDGSSGGAAMGFWERTNSRPRR